MTVALPLPPPARPFLRRSLDCVQVGTDPERAVVVDRVDADAVRALLHLDGRVTHHELVSATPGLATVLAVLEEQGLLDQDGTGALGRERRARHVADLGALGVRTGSRRAAERVLARRARRGVVVRGNDRAAAHVAVGLAAAGLGSVALAGPDRTVGPGDLTPLGPEEPERQWHEQVAAAVRRQGAHPTPATIRSRRPDLVIVCAAADTDLPWTDPELADDLLADGVAHLPVAVSGDAAVVGPLVLPGRTACLWCEERRRTDADRAWPALADQLRTSHARARSGDGPLTVLAAGFAVTQALRVVDGFDPQDPPACLGARLVLRGPDGVPEREAAQAHPLCGCGWSATGDTMVR